MQAWVKRCAGGLLLQDSKSLNWKTCPKWRKILQPPVAASNHLTEATCHTFLKELHEHTPDMPMYAVAWFLDFISPSYVSASAFEPAQHEETWPSFGCPELEET